MSDKDEALGEAIQAVLNAIQPKERRCCICHRNFVGTRLVCSDECSKYLPTLRAYNREHVWHRPADYVSTARKTFLFDQLPDDLKDPKDK